MPEFMLILHDHPADFQRRFSAADMQQIIEDYRSWAMRMAKEGRLSGKNKLRDDGGKVVAGEPGRTRVVDGPYAEAKEVVGGYFIVKADDYAQAVELAKSCPHLKYGPKIDVREIEQFKG